MSDDPRTAETDGRDGESLGWRWGDVVEAWVASRPPALPPGVDEPTLDPDRLGFPAAYEIGPSKRKRRRSPEQVLLDIIESHRGPILQAELRNRTSFGPAQTSRALSTLEEDGHIIKQRVGKHNQILSVTGGGTDDGDTSEAIDSLDEGRPRRMPDRGE